MKPPVRVLLVEDHFLARIALHGVLDAQPGFQIVANVPGAGGVRTVQYGQFVDLTTVPEVMVQLCPA